MWDPYVDVMGPYNRLGGATRRATEPQVAGFPGRPRRNDERSVAEDPVDLGQSSWFGARPTLPSPRDLTKPSQVNIKTRGAANQNYVKR